MGEDYESEEENTSSLHEEDEGQSSDEDTFLEGGSEEEGHSSCDEDTFLEGGSEEEDNPYKAKKLLLERYGEDGENIHDILLTLCTLGTCDIIGTNGDYEDLVYEVITLDLEYEEVYEYLTPQPIRIGWNNPVFATCLQEQIERDDFIEKPPEVVEGVFTCRKCNSKKTYSISKQVRSADEGTSIFVMCGVCNNKWRES